MNLNQMKYLTNNVNFVSSTSSSSASSSAADLFELPSNFYSISNSSTSSATSPLFNETQVMETSIPPYTKFNNTQMNSVFNTPSDIASNDFQDLNSHNNNTNNNNNSVTDNETSSWDDVLINDSEIKFESKNYELPRLPSQRQLTNRKFNSAPAINTISSQSTTVNDTIKHLPLDFELGIDYNFDHDSGNSNQLINFETFIDLHNKNNSFSAVENKLTANNATKTPISTSPLTSTTTEKASGNKRRRNSDKRSKSVVEATIYEEALAAGNDEDADNSDDNQQNNNNSKSNIDDLEMHESMDGSNSPNNKRISDARLSLVELAKVLKLEHDVKETALRERNILAVLKEDLGFELGLRTWIRDTPSAERLKLMGELCKLVEDKYHYGYGKSTLETIVRRASYYLMQGRLRRERRAARKRKLISSKQQQLLKSNTDESASSSTTSPSV
ncbi:unnamed protein product [[Candida] boidinii]|uniref:Unnamed protein product n=1 Tax=Candida boidinii TaxID=5477 RepID=A0A9W6WLP4_CANBO|nr:unnamed protein product [[Candida] boidinii]